jgi:CheY-like chemotaxis protein
MADKAMDVYLNDHLAGAMLGSDLAKQIRARSEGTPLADIMGSVAPQIEEDRQTLIALMARIGTSRNPVKRAVGWVTEKASRVKLSGLTAGEPDLGIFMSLETLALGVQGKLGLWKALQQVADRYPAIRSVDLDQLIERAQNQHDLLEHARLSAGAQALTPGQVSA